MAAYEAYEFGPFVLEVSERRLAKNGRITLPPKAFDLLTVLVRQAGQLVTKRELLDEVWAETNVEEGIFAVHVSSLRTALVEQVQELPIEIARLLTFHVVPPDCAAHNGGRRDHSARA
jgi:DNA-binding winged helix-turn-helix (wHTH) protein